MALLKSFCCCSLLQSSIITGVYVVVAYLAAFVMELCLVMEGENWVNSGKEKGPLPLPGYILVVLHFTVIGLAIIMLYALYQKRVGVLLAWVIVMVLIFLPELVFVLYTVVFHWEISSTFGIAEMLFYMVRAPVNVMCILSVYSLYSTWKAELETEKSFKKLSEIQMMREIKSKPLGYRNAAYRSSTESLSIASPAGSLRGTRSILGSGIYPEKYDTIMNGTIKSNGSFKMSKPTLSKRFQPSDYAMTNGNFPTTFGDTYIAAPYWPPYIWSNHYGRRYEESASEFNASRYPACIPCVGNPGLNHSRSEQNLCQGSQAPPSFYGSTLYSLSSVSRGLLDPEYMSSSSPIHPDYTTQSLDRRRYLRRSQSLSLSPTQNPYHGYPRHQESKSSLGAESDDFRRYRDVAL